MRPPVREVEVGRGLEALGWVVDERGLGGGREMDGIAWTMPLHELWESYVESVVRRETSSGPIRRTDHSATSSRTLWLCEEAPVQIVDAKYKAHLAELDEHGWHRFTDDVREAHRADIHQVLAYAALYAADDVHAALVYPLRRATFDALQERGRDRSVAELFHGARRVRLELRGLPFGAS